MTPLISRDAPRFGRLYRDTRLRVPPRRRTRAYATVSAAPIEEPAPGSERYARHFMTAFAGGLVFFSVLIF